MKNLYLDLAANASVIACVTEQETIKLVAIDARMGDEKLLPVIEEMLTSASWSFDQLTHISCIVGPGGFTSVRLAVALVNMLADQLGVPVIGLRGDEVYEARIDDEETRNPLSPSGYGRAGKKQRNDQLLNSNDRSFVWLHATKKEALFVRGFGTYADQFPEPILKTIDELLSELPEGAIVAGEILPEQRTRLASKNMIDASLRSIEETLPSLLSDQKYSSELLVPWYGRGW